MESLGTRIQAARKEKNIMQKELGRLIGAAKATISGYEAGNRKPDADTLLKIARTLDVTVDYLLGHESPEMVRRYVNMLAGDVEAQHKKYSPLDGLVKKKRTL